MPFDVSGARKAGYSDAEIAGYLGESGEFDVDSARKSGYSDSEIVEHFSGPRQVEQKREETVGRLFKSFGTGVIADTLSWPVAGFDLIGNIADRAEGKTPPDREPADLRMRRAAGPLALPPGDEPSGALERGLRFMGGSAATMPLTYGLGKGVAATGGGKNLLTKMLEQTYRRPVASAASEAVGSMGAGIGGQVASELEPDSTVAQAIFELTGGVVAPMAMNSPAALATRGAIAVGRNIKNRFTNEAVISSRAGARLRELVSEEQLKRLDDLPPELAQNLTLGEQMRSPGLRGVEEAIALDDPDYVRTTLAKAQAKAKAAQDYLAGLTQVDSSPGQAINAKRQAGREAIQARLAAAKAAVEARAEVAGLKANMAVQAAGQRTDPEEIGKITRDIIDGEYEIGRKFEKEVHEKVNKTLPVAYDSFVASHNDEIARLSSVDADPSVIPGWARERVDAYLEDPSRTTGDLLALRRRFTDAARAEAGSEVPNRTRLTYLNKMQAALLNDLDAVPDSNAREAAAVSRELNDKFTRGAVGRLLGYEKTGEVSTIPEAALREVTRGLPEEVGVNIDQLLAAAPQAKPQVESFIINEFLDRAFVEGKFQHKQAITFLDDPKNKIMLKRFPHLMRRFTDAKDMQAEYEAAIESGKIAYKSMSDSWETALKAIQPLDYNQQLTSAMSARRGGEEQIAALRKELAFDEMAAQGLKADVIGEVMDRSVVSVTTDGIKLWDHGKLANNLLKYKTRLKAAGVTDEEMKRLTTIMSYLERIATPIGDKKVIGDIESRGLETGARIVGADIGKALPSAGGGSASLQRISIFSAEFKRRAQGWLKNMDKAQQEISEAVVDKEKFKQLYRAAPPPAGKKIRIFQPVPYNFSIGVGQTEGRE